MSEADACAAPALTHSQGGGMGTRGGGGPGRGEAALTSDVLDAPGQEGSPAGAGAALPGRAGEAEADLGHVGRALIQQ